MSINEWLNIVVLHGINEGGSPNKYKSVEIFQIGILTENLKQQSYSFIENVTH